MGTQFTSNFVLSLWFLPTASGDFSTWRISYSTIYKPRKGCWLALLGSRDHWYRGDMVLWLAKSGSFASWVVWIGDLEPLEVRCKITEQNKTTGCSVQVTSIWAVVKPRFRFLSDLTRTAVFSSSLPILSWSLKTIISCLFLTSISLAQTSIIFSVA